MGSRVSLSYRPPQARRGDETMPGSLPEHRDGATRRRCVADAFAEARRTSTEQPVSADNANIGAVSRLSMSVLIPFLAARLPAGRRAIARAFRCRDD